MRSGRVRSGEGAAHLRQWVREVFCSMSRERSRKSSSLLRTVSQHRQRVSFVSVPWNTSWTHVGLGGWPSAFCWAVGEGQGIVAGSGKLALFLPCLQFSILANNHKLEVGDEASDR